MDKLVRLACLGDEQALQAVYEASQLRVFRLALALLGNPHDAEEVMQDVLHYALSRIKRFDPQRSAWTTWLHTITVSRCRDRWRRKCLHTLPLVGSLLGGARPEKVAEQRELTGAVHAALLQLSPKLREAVALRFLGELSFGEIGTILGCSDRTAQSRVRLGLAKLRSLIEHDPVFDGLLKEVSL